MFLTKKSLIKIIVIAVCYVLIGSICIIADNFIDNLGEPSDFLLILGIITYLLCVPIAICGYYAEGKGKLINSGNKLIGNELNPQEFIRQYELLKESQDLIIKKPNFEVLQLAATAYDALDYHEKALETVDEMLIVANDKKKILANIIKSSLLFSNGKIEEAEAIFEETQKQKMDIISKNVADVLLKTDRSMAMGDYKTAQIYNLNLLERKFPKPNNYTRLIAHYMLAETYEKTLDNENAISHYRYCTENGGQTAIKKSAKDALERLEK